MEQVQVLEILKDTINGKRHKHYERTVNVSKQATTYVTGEGLDDMLVQFTRRESPEAFKQRKDITKHVAPAVVGCIMDVFQKVPRANYARIVDAGSEAQTVTLEGIMSSFWGDGSLDDYMATRYIELNGCDPNSFVCVEFGAFDGARERVRPYPFEVSSAAAVNYEYKNNRLQWLCVQTIEQVKNKDGEINTAEKYTLYLPDRTVVAFQQVEKNQDPFQNVGGTVAHIESKRGHFFDVSYPTPHNAGFVPAVRVGVLRDQATKGETYLPLFAAAIPYLEKALKINSELDLSISLFAFPLSIRYEESCDAEMCYMGRVEAKTCGACHGTGFKKRPTSAQEEIVLNMPKAGEAMPDLTNFIVYKQPPTETLQFMSDYLKGLVENCKQAVFNTDIFTRNEVADTATGKRLDMDNVYDTLHRVAVRYSNVWGVLVKATANFADLGANLKAVLVFGKDFRLKGLNELITDLEAANRAEAGAEVRNAIQEQIARYLHADDSVAYSRYLTKEYHNPFQGKSTSEVMTLLQMPSVRNRDKVLYSNLESIIDELESENTAFYSLNRAKQKELIQAKVVVIEAEQKESAAALLPKIAFKTA